MNSILSLTQPCRSVRASVARPSKTANGTLRQGVRVLVLLRRACIGGILKGW